MSKVYKGYELLKAITDGEIGYGTKFKVKDWNEIVVYEQSNLIFREIFDTKEEGSNYGETIFDLWNLDYILSAEFELIEDEVDIDSIKETEIKNDGMKYFEYKNDGATESGYSKNYSARDIETRIKINELVQAVKQLNKEIKELKEK